ncbi:nucleotide sugar dehydrogenase [Seiridium cupressi]
MRDSTLSLSTSAVPMEQFAAEQTLQRFAYTNNSGAESPPSGPPSPFFNNWPDGPTETTISSPDQIPEIVSHDDPPTVAVLGVGYVGTHLVDTFATKFPVIGFDVSTTRIKDLAQAQMKNPACLDIEYTYNTAALRRATHFLISVPTLLRNDRSIDASFLSKALQTVLKYARLGSTIVIESSVAVGMTRELLGPMAEMGYFAGMSPERVDPGRISPPVSVIPKIVSALEDIRPGSLNAITRIYSAVFEHIVPVSSPEVAEMAKLYENCQRMVCIAYANEMADVCYDMGIDPYEVCRASATKPFGYMDYRPGLGVGGHCIPVNPFHLLSNSNFPLLKEATLRMHERPKRIGLQLLDNILVKKLSGTYGQSKPRVLTVGMGFKRGQSVLSYSPGLMLLNTLHGSTDVDVNWADSLVPQNAIAGIPKLDDKEWHTLSLAQFDMIFVVFLQPGMDEEVLHKLPARTEVKWLSV